MTDRRRPARSGGASARNPLLARSAAARAPAGQRKGVPGAIEDLERLAALSDARAVGPLSACLSDADWRVRVRACAALGCFGASGAIQSLVGALEDTAWPVRVAACQALGRQAPPAAVEPLMPLLEDRYARVRRAASEALGSLGDPKAARALAGRLEDRAEAVRSAACQALSTMGPAAVSPLIDLLGSAQPAAREQAGEILERLGRGDIARAVLGALRGERYALARLARLAESGDYRVQDPFIPRLRDGNREARRSAGRALDVISHVLGRRLGELFCPLCLARFERKTLSLGWLNEAVWYACRACGKAGGALTTRTVVAVLDETWDAEMARDGDSLRVNWLKRKAILDFDRVDIVRAGERDVELLCIQAGNDMGEFCGPRFRRMECSVESGCALSENALRILRCSFGKLVVKPGLEESR